MKFDAWEIVLASCIYVKLVLRYVGIDRTPRNARNGTCERWACISISDQSNIVDFCSIAYRYYLYFPSRLGLAIRIRDRPGVRMRTCAAQDRERTRHALSYDKHQPITERRSLHAISPNRRKQINMLLRNETPQVFVHIIRKLDITGNGRVHHSILNAGPGGNTWCRDRKHK